MYIQDTAFLRRSSWTQDAIWGSGKESAAGISLSPAPQLTTVGIGIFWGRGRRGLIDHRQPRR